MITAKKNDKNKDNLRDLWEIIKYINVHIIRVPEGEEKEEGPEKEWMQQFKYFK